MNQDRGHVPPAHMERSKAGSFRFSCGPGPLVIIRPDAWDYREFSRREINGGRNVVFMDDVGGCSADPVEPLSYIDQACESLKVMNPGGVLSNEDYPGSLLANAICERLNLPGTPMAAALRSHHKYLSRVEQLRCVPEFVPAFAIVGKPGVKVRSRLPYPFFAKPVKSMFQLYAGVVRDDAECRVRLRKAKVHLNEFSRGLGALLSAYRVSWMGASQLLGEAIVSGRPFTVEGYVFRGRVRILGIVDATYYRGTRSYRSFVYPSELPDSVHARVEDLCCRLLDHLEYFHGPFNLDCLFHETADRIWLLEINARAAAQLGDLFEKVDGISGFRVTAELALDHEPTVLRRKGSYPVAGSFVFRRFADARVRSINAADVVAKAFPDCRAHVYYSAGESLSDDSFQELKSYVYAVVNIGAKDKRTLEKRAMRCHDLLNPKFLPIR